MRLSRRLAVLLSLSAPVAACSTSSSQSGGGWPDSSVEGGDDGTTAAGDDVGTGDAPEGDGGPQGCPCGSTFTSCPASRPCVTGVATQPACVGKVCCGPASACDGGADAGDASIRDASRDAAKDAAKDGAKDATKD
jgi:hypothetical protein